MNYLNLNIFCFYCCRPAHRSAQAGLQARGVAETAGPQAGPDRGQAGGWPEGAGLLAGPGRVPGRSRSRANRPPGRSGRCPGRKHGDRDAAVAAGGTTARSVAARERGKSGKRERRSRPHQELVGVARCGQGGPRRPENRRGRERRAAEGPCTGEHDSLDPEPPS